MDVKQVSITKRKEKKKKSSLKEVEILLQKRNKVLVKILLKYSVHIREVVNFIPFLGHSSLTLGNLNTCTTFISH